MNGYIILCSLLLVGVITHQSMGRVARSRSAEVLARGRSRSRSEEVGLRRPRPIPGLRPIESIRHSGFSAETNVDQDELQKLLNEYGIDFDTDETRRKNAEQRQRDQYEINLEKDSEMRKENAYHDGRKGGNIHAEHRERDHEYDTNLEKDAEIHRENAYHDGQKGGDINAEQRESDHQYENNLAKDTEVQNNAYHNGQIGGDINAEQRESDHQHENNLKNDSEMHTENLDHHYGQNGDNNNAKTTSVKRAARQA